MSSSKNEVLNQASRVLDYILKPELSGSVVVIFSRMACEPCSMASVSQPACSLGRP